MRRVPLLIFLAFLLLGAGLYAQAPADPSLEVKIASSKDGTSQPAIFYIPPGSKAIESGPAVPLVVFLHSWSADYRISGPALAESRRRGWAFIGPNFRGPNERPESCGSDFAVQDVLDSVDYAKRMARIDPKRIYLVGSSGGGFMALVMATRAPTLWAAVSTWVPITDLAEWHAFSKSVGSQYYQMMEKCFGGPPDVAARVEEYRRRSPLFELSRAKGLRIAIDSGLRDGYGGGAVPLSQTLLAFNELAKVNGFPGKSLSAEQIEVLSRESRIPSDLENEKQEEAGRSQRVLFRRIAGPVRLTLFDGGHSVDVPTSFRWLDFLAPL